MVYYLYGRSVAAAASAGPSAAAAAVSPVHRSAHANVLLEKKPSIKQVKIHLYGYLNGICKTSVALNGSANGRLLHPVRLIHNANQGLPLEIVAHNAMAYIHH